MLVTHPHTDLERHIESWYWACQPAARSGSGLVFQGMRPTYMAATYDAGSTYLRPQCHRWCAWLLGHTPSDVRPSKKRRFRFTTSHSARINPTSSSLRLPSLRKTRTTCYGHGWIRRGREWFHGWISRGRERSRPTRLPILTTLTYFYIRNRPC